MSTTHINDRLEVVFNGPAQGDGADGPPTAEPPAGQSPVDEAAPTSAEVPTNPPARPQAESGLTAPEPWGRPTFTITDAAAACGVSRKTITRKLAELAAHGAAKDDDGIWRIPVEALLAVGLHPGRSLPRPDRATAAAPRVPSAPPVAESSVPGDGQTGPEMISVPRERWDDLRIRLARAEAEAAERALALSDARLALRALTAGPAMPAPFPPPSTGIAPSSSEIAPSPAPVAPPSAGIAPPAQDTPSDQMVSAPPSAPPATAVPPAAEPVSSTQDHMPRKRRWWQSKG